MKRLLHLLWAALSSRALPPLVLGFFLVVYLGIAFVTDETLITLMAVTRRIPLLWVVLALLPLNGVCRMILETVRYRERRRELSGAAAVSPALYDESVELAAPSAFDALEGRLTGEGYTIGRNGETLAAWRGVTLLPARLLYLAGMFCLFSGILISLVARSVNRQTVIEGAPFPSPGGTSGIVEKIRYARASGPILEKELIMEVADPEGRGRGATYGVYPPGQFGGAFVYPRYLGIALNLRLDAPELPGGVEKIAVLPIYPPGREASTELTGSPYRITLSLAEPDDGTDPYMTGKMTFNFKLLKGKELLLTGTLPGGGEFTRNGYRLTIPDYRRMVMTDFVRDPGVLLIWATLFLFVLAALIWMPVRFFLPRREMLFRSEGGVIHAVSRAEGKRRRHAGVFQEALDLLETTTCETRKG